MDHTPFIVGAYAVTALVLGWVALAPLLQARRFTRKWHSRQQRL
jgi:heme exporter protein CcmD